MNQKTRWQCEALSLMVPIPCPCGSNERSGSLGKWSLPLGNGYFGANVFGRTDTERIQLTEKSLSNPYGIGGLNNFSETYLDFGHTTVENYERGLLLNEAFAYVKYDCAGVHYERTYFTSYPDRVMVVYLTASKPAALSFTLRPTIPFVRDYSLKEGDQAGKSGSITAHGDTLLLSGRMHYYNILFEGQFRVLPQGEPSPFRRMRTESRHYSGLRAPILPSS